MFDKAFNDLMPIEGGDKYTDKPGDLPTRLGITEPVARAFGYQDNIKDLPMDIAKEIYKQAYWDKMSLDDVSKLSYAIAWQLFTIGVNQGITWQVKFLQRSLNCFPNLLLSHYPLKVDGIIGSETMHILYGHVHIDEDSDETNTVLSMLKAQQIMRYMEIVENNPAKADNLNGWIKRVGL